MEELLKTQMPCINYDFTLYSTKSDLSVPEEIKFDQLRQKVMKMEQFVDPSFIRQTSNLQTK